MDIEIRASLRGSKLNIWRDFLCKAGLEPDPCAEQIVLIWDGDTLAATGSRQGNLLKCIAVDAARQGEGLLATVLTTLRQEAFREGHRHLFLYTKPANRFLFTPLFFYPVAQTDQVLLMEDKRNGIHDFLDSLPVPHRDKLSRQGALPLRGESARQDKLPCQDEPSDETIGRPGRVGAVVMNCDPFTLGHQHLVETAAKECDWLYVFVLSEDKGRFSATDRKKMVELGTAHLPNVTVLPTGPYLISSATFPTYFLKEREKADHIHCMLDIEIFTKYFAPKFGITRRYVGTEPLSPMTGQYNDALESHLPERGIELRKLPRLESRGNPISASAVRTALDGGNLEAVRAIVPETTFHYLSEIIRTR